MTPLSFHAQDQATNDKEETMNHPVKAEGIHSPRRVKHSYTQSINGTPEQVFPLLCPVREADWIPDWKTDWVISSSGVAEPDCIFQTPPGPGADGMASIWIVTHHDVNAFNIEMYKVTPGCTVGKLQISLAAQGKSQTAAAIAYEFTSLGPSGDTFLDGFTADWYVAFMQEWETLMNNYLEVGTTPGSQTA